MKGIENDAPTFRTFSDYVQNALNARGFVQVSDLIDGRCLLHRHTGLEMILWLTAGRLVNDFFAA